MTDDNEIGESIVAIGLGILGGLAAAAILSALFRPKCPVCNGVITNGVPSCPHCRSPLQWGGR